MMFKTLFAKLTVSFVILLIAIALFYIAASSFATRYYLRDINQELNQYLAKNIVEDRKLILNGEVNQAALKEIFRQYMVINPSIEIYMIDLNGGIISYSADPGVVKRKHVSLTPILAFLQMTSPYPLLGDDPRSHNQQKAFSVTPVPSAENPQGYLYVILRGQQFDSVESIVRSKYLLTISLLVMLVSLILGLIGGISIFHLLTRRLHQLSELMVHFKDKKQPKAIYNASKYRDEIDQLGLSFNQMAKRIDDQFKQLKKQDSLRRKLVAQVSHDLRTPLASMQGYLETLENKNDSFPQEQQEYLSIAVKQSRHLSAMVDELFELASLEAKEKKPKLEPFSAVELIYDIAQKYQIQAQKKTINILIDCPNDHLFINSDIRLIERILDNLLNNALAYTAAKGQIKIKLGLVNDQLCFAVSDNGKGMSRETLKHLFEPFYRQSTNHSNQHAGLGLAIAKRMTELLNSELKVQSVLSKGTRFSFCLALE